MRPSKLPCYADDIWCRTQGSTWSRPCWFATFLAVQCKVGVVTRINISLSDRKSQRIRRSWNISITNYFHMFQDLNKQPGIISLTHFIGIPWAFHKIGEFPMPKRILLSLLTGVTSNGARNHLSLSKVLWCVGFKPHEFQKITLFLKKSNLRKSHDANQLRYTPFNQHSNGKMNYLKMYFLRNLGVFNQASDICFSYRRSCWILAFLRLDRSSYTPTRQVGELVLPPKSSMEPEHFSQQEKEKHRPKPPIFWGFKMLIFFGGTLL